MSDSASLSWCFSAPFSYVASWFYPAPDLLAAEEPAAAELPAGLDLELHSPVGPSEADQLPEVPRPFLHFVDLDPVFVYHLLQANTPVVCGDLFPPFLDHYENQFHLLGGDSTWGPRARVVRAFRSGVSALRVLNGDFNKQVRAPALRVSNNYYIVLRCRQYPTGFFTASYRCYCQILKQHSGGRGLEPDSVSHSFPTLIEVEIFLRGSRRQWPRELP